MYPLIELITGLLFVACYLDFGVTQTAIKWLFFTCLIIVLTITDLRVRILPDVVNWPGMIVGLFFSLLIPPQDGTAFWLTLAIFHRLPPSWGLGLLDGVLGALFGSLLLWGFAILYKVWRGREGMGLGDVKMMAMVGSFVGWRGVLLTVFAGAALGSLIFIPLSIKKKRLVPFGVFLAVGAVVTFVFGDAIIAWYGHFLKGD